MAIRTLNAASATAVPTIRVPALHRRGHFGSAWPLRAIKLLVLSGSEVGLLETDELLRFLGGIVKGLRQEVLLKLFVHVRPHEGLEGLQVCELIVCRETPRAADSKVNALEARRSADCWHLLLRPLCHVVVLVELDAVGHVAHDCLR